MSKISMFLSVAFVVSLSWVVTKGDDFCAKFSKDGCTAPDETLYKEEFTPACYRHDACYGCGALHNVKRRRCDNAFLSDMKNICRSDHTDRLDECMAMAQFYYTVVDGFGWLFYRRRGRTGNCEGVEPCLP